jgi:peptide/nickel transport system substrate-binding protein
MRVTGRVQSRMRDGTPNRRSTAGRILAIAWFGFVAAACGPGAGERGGTVVVGLRSDFQAFNPIVASAAYTIEVNNFALFTPLVRYGSNLEPEPYLAESWEEHGDTAVTFRLRRDVRWHDGQPVTADDVKFTFDVAKDPTAASLLETAFLARVASAAVVDSFTITFRYVHPHAQAIENFYWAPAPRHLLQDITPAELRNAPFNRQPVGSGPFRFQQWQANEQIVLVRNDDFPEGLGGPPAADRVMFRIIPEASTRMTEQLTRRLHVNMQLLPDQANQLRNNPDVDLHSFTGRTVWYVGWNHLHPPFDNRDVRRALTMAINRQELIDALLFGEGAPATSTLPPWHRLATDVDPLPFDPDAAGRLLDAAGWTVGPDGIRRNPQNQPFRFTLLTSDDRLRQSVVEVIQSQLRRIGVQADVRVMEFQTMLAAHRGRDFEAVVTNWVLDNFEASSAPNSLFHSSNAEIEGSPNRSSVRIPRLDQAIENAAMQTSETDARRAYARYVEILQEEQPVTFLFWQNTMSATLDNIGAVEMDPRGELITIRDWTIAR